MFSFCTGGSIKSSFLRKKRSDLSADAVSSPQILMLSGIGPKQHLQKHKILLKNDLSVGKSLYDHITTYMWFSFNPSETSPTAQLVSIFNLTLHNSLTTVGISLLSAFESLNGRGSIADYQLNYGYQSSNPPSIKSYSID